MTDLNKDEKKQDEVQGQFIDPMVTTPIALFILTEVCKAIISFVTFRFLIVFWNKHIKDRWTKWWNLEEKEESDVD